MNNMMPGILKIRLNGCSDSATVFLGLGPVSGKQLALRLYGSLKRFPVPLFLKIRENVASAAVRTATGTYAVVLGDQNGSGDQSRPGEEASGSCLWLAICNR